MRSLSAEETDNINSLTQNLSVNVTHNPPGIQEGSSPMARKILNKIDRIK